MKIDPFYFAVMVTLFGLLVLGLEWIEQWESRRLMHRIGAIYLRRIQAIGEAYRSSFAQGYPNWKASRLIREQQEQVATVGTDAAQALADAAAAQSTANTAQSTANTGVTNAGTAQTTADEALVTAEGVAQAFGQDQVTGGVSPTPYIVPVNGGTQAEIRLGPGLTADAILYRVYTGSPSGSFGGYSGAFSISPGDTVEAYSTTTGLTDSPVSTYNH